MAFGTGHHGTTKGCLLAYDELLSVGMVPQRVADIGAGTAVLGIAAALTWPNSVLVSDIDPVAVEVAEANAVANGVAARVRCIEAAGFDHPEIAAGAPFDLIFANILKGPLVELAPAMAAHVAPGGHIILSGILNAQADEVIAAYAAEGLHCTRRAELGEWTTLTISP
jgi:ribosomal protein L11 methyltransferase